MKRLSQIVIASTLALSLVYIPAFAQPFTPSSPIEAGPMVPNVDLSIKKMEPLKPLELPVVETVAYITPPAPAPVSAPAQAQSASTGGCETGITSGNYALNQLIQHESGGNSCATNPGGCFGLLQACPGYPLRTACGGNAACQLDWFAANKLGGYGSWEKAWSMWQSRCGSPQGCWW